jgi:hypothetical protein
MKKERERGGGGGEGEDQRAEICAGVPALSRETPNCDAYNTTIVSRVAGARTISRLLHPSPPPPRACVYVYIYIHTYIYIYIYIYI